MSDVEQLEMACARELLTTWEAKQSINRAAANEHLERLLRKTAKLYGLDADKRIRSYMRLVKEKERGND